MIRMLATAVALEVCLAAAVTAQVPDLRLVGFTDSELTRAFALAPTAPGQVPAPTANESSELVAVTVVSGLFGTLGFIGGGLLSHGDFEQRFGRLLAGGALGAWVGGGLGGTTVTGRPLPSFLGSAVGLIPGFFVLANVEGKGWLLAPLAHGLVTAAFTQIGR
jgi:hypothetical protein